MSFSPEKIISFLDLSWNWHIYSFSRSWQVLKGKKKIVEPLLLSTFALVSVVTCIWWCVCVCLCICVEYWLQLQNVISICIIFTFLGAAIGSLGFPFVPKLARDCVCVAADKLFHYDNIYEYSTINSFLVYFCRFSHWISFVPMLTSDWECV